MQLAASLLFFIGLGPVLLALFTHTSLRKILGFAAFMTVMMLLALLSVRFKAVDRGIQAFFASIIRINLWVIIVCGPFAVYHWFAQLILARLALGLQIAAFVAWGILLGVALLAIATEHNRKRLFARLRRAGVLGPAVYSCNVLLIAVVFFACVTYIFVNHGVLHLIPSAKLVVRPGQPMDFYGHLQDFYVWHFLDAIPLVKVNETLRWEQPLTYTSVGVGLILLVFKVTVIVPVIAAFAGYWKQEEPKTEAESSTASGSESASKQELQS